MSNWKKLIENIDGNKLCVGIDAHQGLLQDWGLPLSAKGLGNFSKAVIDSYDESTTAALKPQSAFFEQYGSPGIAVLESAIAYASEKGIPVILDAKRGDIGSTMMGYAAAYLTEGSPLAADAVTISPYLGVESLREIAILANKNNRGIFVLCLTSNPEAYELQHAIGDSGKTVAKTIFDFAVDFNNEFGTTIGLVVGATIGDGAKDAGINLNNFNGPLLAPGVGAQGAGAAEIKSVFGEASKHVLPSVSRGVLKAGPSVQSLEAAANEFYESLIKENKSGDVN